MTTLAGHTLAPDATASSHPRKHTQFVSSLLRPGCRICLWPDASAGTPLLDPEMLARLGCTVTPANTDPAQIPGPTGSFDLVLLRGRIAARDFERGARLLSPAGQLVLVGPPDATLDSAKAALREHGHIGPQIGDAGGEHLWYGGHNTHPLHEQAAELDPSTFPRVVNFFTLDTPYEREVQGLIESCKRVGWPCEPVGVRPRGRWELNCAYKARFVREQWLAGPRRPIVWIDADAVVHRIPPLIAAWSTGTSPAPDLAIHKHHGWTFASGTVYFGASDLTGELLDRWVELSEIDASQWDQVHLAGAWEDVAGARPLHTVWLPQAYTKISHWPDEDGTSDRVVVEHLHASSRFQGVVSGGAPPLPRGVYPQLRAPHGASRPQRAAPAQVTEHLADLAGLVAAIAPRRILEVTSDLPTIETVAGCALRPAPAVEHCSPARLDPRRAADFDLVCARDLPDIASEDANRLVTQLRGAARVAFILGAEIDSRAAVERITSWRPDRHRIYSTAGGRAWALLAWARCPLPELQGLTPASAPQGATQEPAANAAMETRLNQLHRALLAGTRFSAFLRSALIRSVAARCLERGYRKIALYGAGRHTRDTLQAWRATGIQVAVIFDDAPRQDLLNGIPVRAPGAGHPAIDAVIVSSDAHETALAARARAVWGAMPVLTIYDDTFDFESLST